ncbi:MAG: 50S ribosomal protein L21 [Cellvibrionales bacterium]|jgi:large subunit ribosomal protein L21|nr:50S ribosomal protein L21 [Cellvibrionales bacterium]
MYAVIESGGKQHRVIEGEVLNVELLEAAAGDKIDFNEVLMVGNGADVKIGAPFVAGGKVSAEVVGHGRADKIHVIKFRRRKHFRKQMGHRQWFTQIKITAISA